ncbi:MAG TPA: deoxyribodipyrimidine photo-lyase [Saprospiraceae bacterium]|nr:deoxyribodipyrimidine photo-lyase [Saprospiraceae bacterium]HPK10169.1 deoxyribodipyrimidine photo-lyase [Saprospiraceae bacterium]HPQ20585.1 deoxyribodipyrimidine photo-lyase [Saprospiraceae bacterium]
MTEINIFWYRRDLRIDDNVGLYKALKGKYPVQPIFIFDKTILNELPKNDARVSFIYKTISELKDEFRAFGSDLLVLHDRPIDAFKWITENFNIQHVITNRDYEPYALQRDKEIKDFLESKGIEFHTFKDQVIFETNEIIKSDGKPYVVYTPYSKQWLAQFDPKLHLPIEKKSLEIRNLHQCDASILPSLEKLGFEVSDQQVRPIHLTKEFINEYPNTRNIPSKANGTSDASVHLRFGTVGIRTLLQKSLDSNNNIYLKELIWREFFMQILWHFPHTVSQAFRPEYDRIEWLNDTSLFEKWKNGNTGYPMVDAGMRELNETGYMHNRVRMVTASFLCKHLLIEWRWGEHYFAEKLLDFELSSNVGNWQWASGSGVDAAPYFRIFNPESQLTRFDPDLKYIKKWVPEYGTKSYPQPIVEHKYARERCLETYKKALNS